MPRLARLDAPGVLHHIMIRGIERRKIFLNEKDYEDFIERLSVLLPADENGLLFLGVDPKSCTLSFVHGNGAPCPVDEKTAHRVRGQFQSAAHTPRASLSKSVQIDYLPGKRLFEGIGSLYSLEPCEIWHCN